MSTKFPTLTSIEAAIPLTVLLEAVSRSVLQRLAGQLHVKGHASVTEPHLILLGNLDCGSTHAARIANRMGVSRQAVSKTVREMQALGYLEVQNDPDRGNQKLVVMTENGRHLATAARQELAVIEASLAGKIGAEAMTGLRRGLELIWRGEGDVGQPANYAPNPVQPNRKPEDSGVRPEVTL